MMKLAPSTQKITGEGAFESKRRPSGTIRGFAGLVALNQSLDETEQPRPNYYEQTTHTQQVVAPTQRELFEYRKARAIPDASYDLDGDGAVGQRDYFFAKAFDADGDGVLSAEEVRNARAALVRSSTGQLSYATDPTLSTRPVFHVKQGTPGKTRAQLLEQRKRDRLQENMHVKKREEEKIQEVATRMFPARAVYPWAASIDAPDVNAGFIDKITTTSGDIPPYSLKHKNPFFAGRDKSTPELPSIDLNDWHDKRKLRHKDAVWSKAEQVLAKSNDFGRPGSFGETYYNIVAQNREQEISSRYGPPTRASGGTARLALHSRNNDRTTGSMLEHHTNEPMDFDPYATYGNPDGKTLKIRTQRIEAHTVFAAGMSSGHDSKRPRGLNHVKPTSVFNNGNALLDAIVPQSKFGYRPFSRA